MNAPVKVDAPVPAPTSPAATVRRRASKAEPLWMALFDPVLFGTMKQMAGIMLRSGFLPRAIRTEEQVITILIKGYELGLPPMEALSGISVIDGKPAVSPQLMLALINRSGEAQDVTIDGDAAKCTVTMTRRGRKPHTETFTIEMARKMMSREEGRSIPLADKYNWRQMPAVMLRWRAVSACARIVFPDVISGLYTPDEMGADVSVTDDGTMHVVDVAPSHAPASQQEPARSTAPADVNTETGEVLATPTAAPEPAKPAPAETAPVAPAAPVAADLELTDLINRAAIAQGYQGPDPVGHWLSLNYLTGNLDDLSEAERADARARAQSVLDTQPTPEPAIPTAAREPAGAMPPTKPAAPPVAPAADNEPPLTPEEATALRTLLTQAAAAEGLTGKGATLKWVTSHFGITGKKLEDVPGDVRAKMRDTALRILEARETAPAAATKTPAAAAPAPAIPVTPALPATPHAQPATPEQIDAIRHDCASRGIVNPATEPIITWAVKAKFDTLEDLTAAQADRILRALRYNGHDRRTATPA